jgi:TRAP-type C4-dicarboxylate transport system permease small subunit
MTEQKIIDDEGHFHAQDEAVDLSDTIAEGWISLAIFWLLGLTVFYQFVTRYVMNDSAAWTEEVARYMLIGVVFIGAAVGVAKNNQIQVDFFYRHMPRAMGRVLSMAVDVLRTAFFVAAVVMTIQMMMKIGNQTRMTIVDLPMNVVYALCVFGFAAMAWRSLQVLRTTGSAATACWSARSRRSPTAERRALRLRKKEKRDPC